MLSYQHIFHAGNFADVHKHALLAVLMKTLAQKPLPLSIIDTHAGRGFYDLGSSEAAKTGEYKNGIDLLRDDNAPLLRPYLDIVAAAALYPGSSAIIRHFLRAGDRLTSAELHPGEYTHLSAAMAGDARIAPVKADGIKEMAAGAYDLCVIDPSYEIKDEYAILPAAIGKAWKKKPKTIFFVWYPMMAAGGHDVLLTGLRQSGLRDMLASEITLDKPPQEHFRMYGTGVVIINPPWPAQIAQSVSQSVAARMPQGAAGKTFWLDNTAISPQTGLITRP